MKVLMASAELHPVAKAGGLADMVAALARELGNQELDVRCAIPGYRAVQRGLPPDVREVGSQEVALPVWGHVERARVRHLEGAALPAPILLVEHPVFDRDGIYDDPATREGYGDNGYRWAVFCRGVHASLGKDGWIPDVVHGHDQQGAPLVALLRWAPLPEALSRRPGLVYTIHNVEYQGVEDAGWMAHSGLPLELLRPMGPAEFHGGVNLMKLGILAADRITTVSPRYAQEIRTSAFGAGLERVLAGCGERLSGILNGVDTQTWDPAVDPHLPVRYTPQSFAGKAYNRQRLVEELGLLPPSEGRPLFGWVGRLTSQKGVDLLLDVLDVLLRDGVSMVLLGSGERRYERALEEAARRQGGRLAVRLGFDEGLAHRIEGGADAFLMPSRYEPCGLNQMYSLRYGTVPVVREVGGLADTVRDADRDGMQGNGFTFGPYAPDALLEAARRAMAAYSDPARWRMLALRGMAEDFSWEEPARAYQGLYRETLA
ncbi:MAG TPA: glycogen synthase [Candidatus Polarisedimenticolaceae bacterium]|nr:glycogen synthase [Candidatus Polarisedimenticolaceae bacterium]